MCHEPHGSTLAQFRPPKVFLLRGRVLRVLSCAALICCLTPTPQAVKGESDKVSNWIDDLRSPNASVRIRAAYAFDRLAPLTRTTALSLIEGLRDKDPYVRRYCASALGEIGIAPDLTVPALSVSLRDRDQHVREHAAIALARIGPPAVPSLIESLGNTEVAFTSSGEFRLSKADQTSRSALGPTDATMLADYAAFALIEIGPLAVPLIMEASTSKDFELRRRADYVLREIGNNSESDLPFFLNDKNRNLSLWAAIGLSRQKAESKYRRKSDASDRAVSSDQLLPVLEKALKENNKVLCLKAIDALPDAWDEYAGVVPASTKLHVVPELIRLLTDENDDVRAKAVRTLAKIDPEDSYSENQIIKMASDPTPQVRRQAVRALSVNSYGNAKLVDAIIKALTDVDEDVQDSAIYAIERIQLAPSTANLVAASIANIVKQRFAAHGTLAYDRRSDISLAFSHYDTESYAALLELLTASDEGIRSYALQTLEDLSPRDEKVLAAVLRLSNDPRKSIRMRVAHFQVVVIERQSGVDALIELLSDSDPEVRREAIKTLEDLRGHAGKALPALIKATEDPAPEVRAAAVSALIQIDNRSPAFADALVRMLSDSDPIVKQLSAQGIPEIGGVSRKRIAEKAIPEIVKAINSGSGREPEKAWNQNFFEALRSFDSAAFAAFMELLASPQTEVAAESSRLLIELARGDSKLSAQLIGLLGDSRTCVRSRAISIFARQAALTQPVISALVNLLSDPSVEVRVAVLLTLLRADRESLVVVRPDVEKLLKDREPEVRIAAIRVIWKINSDDDAAVRALLKELDYPYSRAREEYGILYQANPIVQAFSEIGERSVPVLVDSLTNSNVNIRRNASAVLMNIARLARTAISAVTLSLKDSDPEVRLNAARAIETYGRDAPRAATFLLPLLEDPDEEIRKAAANALFALDIELTNAGPALDTELEDEFIDHTLHNRMNDVSSGLRLAHDHTSYSGAAGAKFSGPKNGLPDFPWPPPRFSDFCVLPRHPLGAETDNLDQVGKRIVDVLQAAGYNGKSFFAVPGGFAIATRLERINDDGTSYVLPYRWTREKIGPASLKGYMRALFLESPGQFRMFVFVISNLDAIPSNSDQLTEGNAAELAGRGGGILPYEIGKIPFRGRNCQVLVYRFQKIFGHAGAIQYSDPLGLSAEKHLRAAELSRLLAY